MFDAKDVFLGLLECFMGAIWRWSSNFWWFSRQLIWAEAKNSNLRIFLPWQWSLVNFSRHFSEFVPPSDLSLLDTIIILSRREVRSAMSEEQKICFSITANIFFGFYWQGCFKQTSFFISSSHTLCSYIFPSNVHFELNSSWLRHTSAFQDVTYCI